MEGSGIIRKYTVGGCEAGTEPTEGGDKISSLLRGGDFEGDCPSGETGEQNYVSSSEGASGQGIGTGEVNTCEVERAPRADSGKVDSRRSWGVAGGFSHLTASEAASKNSANGLSHPRNPEVLSEGNEESGRAAVLLEAVVMVDYQVPECVLRVEEERIVGRVLCQRRVAPNQALLIKAETSLVKEILVFRSEGDLAAL